jgi:hypothetical protein
MLTMSVGVTERLAYAWLDGSDRGHAVVRLDVKRIPSRFLDAIRQTVRSPPEL